MPTKKEEPIRHNLGAWAEQLACPACFQSLGLEGACVVCTACGRSYPIVDGIAVLISERAKRPERAKQPDR